MGTCAERKAIKFILIMVQYVVGAFSSMVEALHYKLKGCGFDSHWCHWNFLLAQSYRPHYGPGVDSTSNRNEYQEYFLEGKCRRCVGLTALPPAHANCFEMWEPQSPGTHRDCFTFYKYGTYCAVHFHQIVWISSQSSLYKMI